MVTTQPTARMVAVGTTSMIAHAEVSRRAALMAQAPIFSSI